MQQSFGDAEMGGGTDGQEFGEAFDNSQQDGQKILVQVFSPKVTVETRFAASYFGTQPLKGPLISVMNGIAKAMP